MTMGLCFAWHSTRSLKSRIEHEFLAAQSLSRSIVWGQAEFGVWECHNMQKLLDNIMFYHLALTRFRHHHPKEQIDENFRGDSAEHVRQNVDKTHSYSIQPKHSAQPPHNLRTFRHSTCLFGNAPVHDLLITAGK
jgi:hypothetical protein